MKTFDKFSWKNAKFKIQRALQGAVGAKRVNCHIGHTGYERTILGMNGQKK